MSSDRMLFAARACTSIGRVQKFLHKDPWHFKLCWYYPSSGLSCLGTCALGTLDRHPFICIDSTCVGFIWLVI